MMCSKSQAKAAPSLRVLDCASVFSMLDQVHQLLSFLFLTKIRRLCLQEQMGRQLLCNKCLSCRVGWQVGTGALLVLTTFLLRPGADGSETNPLFVERLVIRDGCCEWVCLGVVYCESGVEANEVWTRRTKLKFSRIVPTVPKIDGCKSLVASGV